MIYKVSDNIVSPLGVNTGENYQALKTGRSALRRYEHHWQLPEPFAASLFDPGQVASMQRAGMTRFESLATESIQRALSDVPFDVSAPDVVLILASTKGSVEDLDRPDGCYRSLGESALMIAKSSGITTLPVVVCNACVSGVSSIQLAFSLLSAGTFRHAVVCGADVQNRFVVSGFQSLKAVTATPCRPFDIERTGLNLGEAAATMVLSSIPPAPDAWKIAAVAAHNDAFHLSSPSKMAEGAYRALKDVCEDFDISDIAFVNAHGTATMYNDQMESVAIERAGLASIPVNAMKGTFGHTLGAAGLLETILSMEAIDDYAIPATRGFSELGVSGKIRVTTQNSTTDKRSFVKLISGFGGGNAALLATKKDVPSKPSCQRSLQVTHRVEISPEKTEADDVSLQTEGEGTALLTNLYKRYVGNYPKFYKMDMLSRLGFVASEILLKVASSENRLMDDNLAVIFFNRTSSIDADRQFLKSISSEEGFFPSPSVFIYTLPNMVTGEIAIRNQTHGVTAFYILPEPDETLMEAIVKAALKQTGGTRAISGWIDYEDEQTFCARLCLVE